MSTSRQVESELSFSVYLRMQGLGHPGMAELGDGATGTSQTKTMCGALAMLGIRDWVTHLTAQSSARSTPIINAPQSAILGLHNIVERPVVKNGEVVVRPIMYLALSYDHRIVDGKESVSFLVRVKEMLEDPGRLILGV